MQKSRKVLLWAAVAALGLSVTVWIVHRLRHPLVLKGVVIVRDKDAGKEVPIAGVEIAAGDNEAEAPARSDPSGLFVIQLRKWVRRSRPITLSFRHPNFKPQDQVEFADGKLYVVRMVPIAQKQENGPTVTISNIRVRYSIRDSRATNVGSAVKTFAVTNIGNIPCNHQVPCSPDGTWKAALGALTLDAGPGNEFQHTRVSCIAGPCPFTRVESADFSQPSQTITARVRVWSDTATFLVEAEVIHVLPTDVGHETYPVVFGQALNFTLPAGADAVSFEVDVGGETIIFPVGPSLFLNWATCSRTASRQDTIFRCDLKPGFRF